MIVTHQTSDLPAPPAAGTVVSLGVFDGVHLGHSAILAANVARAQELGARPTVVTFKSHPKEVLLGRAPRTLTTLEHRLDLFRRAGIEHTLVLCFDDDLRCTPAVEFANDLLLDQLGARALVLGFDSKFGRDQAGTPELLRQMGFPVEVVQKVVIDQRAVSSTAIREAVELGDLEGARTMLGRPVSVLGEVVRGSSRGRTLGFPTANLDLHHELHPPAGVYAGHAHLLASDADHTVEQTHPAVCNVGTRPTIQDQKPRPQGELLVEVHLLDFEGDIYGRRLELEFIHHLRDERRFDGLDALKAQIGLDVSAARAILA